MMKRILFTLFLLSGLALFLAPHLTHAQRAEKPGAVHVLTIDGAISPAYADYLKDEIADAQASGAGLIVVEMNTPGGLLTSTRSMVSAILNSPVPVAVYVTPSGSHAASAGTFILMAGHVAAMDTGTNVGAATPVSIGNPVDFGKDKPGTKRKVGENAEDANARALQDKAKEDTTAFIRSIAEMRGRNVEWAEQAVMNAKSITEREALDQNVIDVVAASREDLLEKIHFRNVEMKDGHLETIMTEGAPVIEKNPGAMTRFLAFICNPNLAAILMMVGIYGLLLEFYAPGSMIPGTIGAISLMLALYAMSILPVSGLGAILLLIGLVFMIAEIFIPSFGILGFGGIIALVIGLAVFFDQSAMPGLELEWQVIIGIALSASVFMGVGFLMFIKSRYDDEASTGPEAMIGKTARVVSWGDGTEGHVFVEGERWNAFTTADEGLFKEGESALISAVDGLRLKIRRTDV